MPHESNVTQKQPLTMPHIAWALLGKYLAVVNYDRVTRGQKAINYTELAGGLLARWVVDHGEEIGRAFEEVWLAAHKESLPHFYEPDQLAAIATAARADIPDVFRIDYRSRETAKRRDAARRTLLRPAQGSAHPSSRSPRLALQIRGRSLALATGFSRRKKKD